MAVLRAIGRFFARIGRWIRDTAWVQPLLIVGGIFAVIFSIPGITSWVKSWFNEGNAATAYYRKNEVSWSGIEDGKSDVDRLFSYLLAPDASENADAANKYGKKFFLNFVQEDCTGCESNYEGFKDLQDRWNKYFVPSDNTELKIFNVFIDAEDSNGKLYFTEYVSGDKSNCRYNEFFDDAATLRNPFMNNVDGGGDDYYTQLAANDNSFTSPTIILIDFDFTDDKGRYDLTQCGVTECMYSVAGKDKNDSALGKASTLFDCWEHTGEFAFKGVK